MTRAVVLGFLGASHCIWVLPIGHVANNALQAFSPVPDVGMWVGTAVILGTGVAIATLRWWAALLPTVCLGMAVLLIRLWPSGLTNLLTFGLMTGATHAGLLATLAVDTHEFLKRRWPQWACAHCGYDLRDLVAPACPECGQPRGRLPTQA